MDKHQLNQLIKNKTEFEVFDTFNEKYSELAISLCCFLAKFQIIAISTCNSEHIDDIGMKESDPFGCFIDKTEYDASSTYAEIVINKKKCEELELSDQEIHAAVAHEIGHVIFFFIEDKENKKDMEEVICDQYACRIGLADSLISLLDKLISSGDYPQGHILLLSNRKRYITAYMAARGCLTK